MHPIAILAFRAEALFASDVQPSDGCTDEVIRAAVIRTERRLGSRTCACFVAHEYGKHPETAAARMQWAVGMVAVAFPPRASTVLTVSVDLAASA